MGALKKKGGLGKCLARLPDTPLPFVACALPAKMSALNSHVRQNAQNSNLKWTLEDLLPV